MYRMTIKNIYKTINTLFPDMNIKIELNDTIYHITFYGRHICYISKDDCLFNTDIFHIKKNDIYYQDNNLSYLIFAKLLFRINNLKSVSLADVNYFNNLTNDQLLRFMNLFLILAEDNKYLPYRQSNDINYLRKQINEDCLKNIH